MTQIIPAILAFDKDSYQKQIRQVEKIVNVVHIDFMDGIFVKNKSVEIRTVGPLSTAMHRIAHLMILNPVDSFPLLFQFGFNGAVIHFESVKNQSDLSRAIMIAKDYNLQLSIALNPETDEKQIRPFLNNLFEIQLMTVQPGSGGQTANLLVLDKIKRIKKFYPNLAIAVDGGIKEDNVALFYQAGVRIFIIGSAIFKQKPAEQIARFNQIVQRLKNS